MEEFLVGFGGGRMGDNAMQSINVVKLFPLFPPQARQLASNVPSLPPESHQCLPSARTPGHQDTVRRPQDIPLHLTWTAREDTIMSEEDAPWRPATLLPCLAPGKSPPLVEGHWHALTHSLAWTLKLPTRPNDGAEPANYSRSQW